MMTWIKAAAVVLFLVLCLVMGIMHAIPQLLETLRWWGIL